ncbi:MAG: LamG domain-containing protein [Candidatus Omnitrophica bacterium]|nr:LamG domain-containing protein [Candidatus Omnitrophota bacterium]
MKKLFSASCLLLLASCILIPTSHAAIPQFMTYQGILKDSSGNYLTGTYSILFNLYDVSSGGTALWTETQSSVSVNSGRFSVQLGSVTTLNLNYAADYWLGVKVGSDSEMTPRVRLTSAGYAYRAEYANQALTQSQHDALTHKNIEGVKDNTVSIAKTNFKLDAYSLAAANNMGDLIVDVFTDASGINSGASSDYTWRGSPNYDVIVTAGGIDSYTKLMLHANGTDASSTFTDSSSGAKSMTTNGNAQIDTAQSKFGAASGLFDGTGDYVTTADSEDWNFGTGDFTLDFWVRFNSLASHQRFAAQRADGSNQWFLGWNTTNILRFDVTSAGATTITIDNSWTPSTGVWYHVAFVRNGNNFLAFVGGAQIGSTQTDSSAVDNFASSLSIGEMGGANYVNGWLDELRISKGIARWTSGFTVPSSEYTGSASSATVVSNAFSETTAPTEAMVIPDETLGTGSITYYVSRDNGTTWTTCTKNTSTSIAAQPSGTQLKWKAVMSGDAELNGVAVAV